MWNALPCVRIAIPRAVDGVICISPIAPDDDFALAAELRLLVDHGGDERRIEAVLGGVHAHVLRVAQRIAEALVPRRASSA